MTDVISVLFGISHPDHQRLDNDTLYRLRREVAVMLEQAEFGEIQEIANSHFQNTYAIPVTDQYYETIDELIIEFAWFTHPVHGNLSFLFTEGIPHFHEVIRNIYHLHPYTRISYSRAPQI